MTPLCSPRTAAEHANWRAGYASGSRWAEQLRDQLGNDSRRLDQIMTAWRACPEWQLKLATVWPELAAALDHVSRERGQNIPRETDQVQP